MQTFISWMVNKEDTGEIVPADFEKNWYLPECPFECGILRKGDKIELEMGLEDISTQYYEVTVVSSKIILTYPLSGVVPLELCQWIYVKG